MYRWLTLVLAACSSSQPTPAPVPDPKPVAPPDAAAVAAVVVDAVVDAVEEPPQNVAPCASGERELLADGGVPVVCGSAWSECDKHPLASGDPDVAGAAACCMKIDVATKKIDHVAFPKRVPAVEVRGKQLCAGTTCKPVGPKLAAALAGLDPQYAKLASATADLKAVAMRTGTGPGGMTVWNVAGDAPMKLAPPAAYRAQGDQAIAQTFAFGNVVVVNWGACAGPCFHARIFTSSGVQVGDDIDELASATEVTDKTFAVFAMPEVVAGKQKNRAQLFDLRTGKPRGKLPLPIEYEIKLAKLGNDAFAALLKDGKIVVVSAANPDKPAVVGELTLPSCTP